MYIRIYIFTGKTNILLMGKAPGQGKVVKARTIPGVQVHLVTLHYVCIKLIFILIRDFLTIYVVSNY
jgi:hypothetical protein